MDLAASSQRTFSLRRADRGEGMQHLREALAELQLMEKKAKDLREEVSRKSAVADQLRRNSKRVQWDEETIAEHDKERGTRMKIDEPKTPYVKEEPTEFAGEDDDIPFVPNSFVVGAAPVVGAKWAPVLGATACLDAPTVYSNAAEEEEIDEEEGGANMTVVSNVDSNEEPGSPPADGGRPAMLDINLVNKSLETAKEAEEQKAGFAKMRKQHYNEFQKLKELREKMKAGILDDEDDEDDDEDEDEKMTG